MSQKFHRKRAKQMIKAIKKESKEKAASALARATVSEEASVAPTEICLPEYVNMDSCEGVPGATSTMVASLDSLNHNHDSNAGDTESQSFIKP